MNTWLISPNLILMVISENLTNLQNCSNKKNLAIDGLYDSVKVFLDISALVKIRIRKFFSMFLLIFIILCNFVIDIISTNISRNLTWFKISLSIFSILYSRTLQMYWNKLPHWYISSVQSLSLVQLLMTPWTAAFQASLPITNSWSLLEFMSIKSVMPSNHLILCCPFLLLHQSLPASGSFPMSQLFTSGSPSIGVSASTAVLPMNIRDWFPLGWAGWISLQFRGLSRVFSNTAIQKYQFFWAQFSL